MEDLYYDDFEELETDIDLDDIPKSENSLTNYCKKFANISVLSQDEEKELFIKYTVALDDTQKDILRNEIVLHNLKFVVYIANKYTNSGMPLDELIQEGNCGLLKAIDKFDYTKGFKFSTYAHWWITQSIRRYIDNNRSCIRRPVHKSELSSKIYYASNELSQILEREPTLEEIAAKTNIAMNDLIDLASDKNKYVLSLDRPLDTDDADSLLGDIIENRQAINPEVENRHAELRQAIFKCFDAFSERDKNIMIYRYGLSGEKPYSLDELGKKYGLSRERCRQICNQCLTKLKRNYAKDLKIYMEA